MMGFTSHVGVFVALMVGGEEGESRTSAVERDIKVLDCGAYYVIEQRRKPY